MRATPQIFCIMPPADAVADLVPDGASLCYTREFRAKHPFPEIRLGEDQHRSQTVDVGGATHNCVYDHRQLSRTVP